MYPAPEDPVPDITWCGGKERGFSHEVWYLPQIVIVSLGKVNSDDLWGVRAVVVKSWCFMVSIRVRKVKGWGGGGSDLRRPFNWAFSFFIKLQRTSGIVNTSLGREGYDDASTRNH